MPTLLKNKQEYQILSPMHKGNVGIKLLNYDIQQNLPATVKCCLKGKIKA